MVDTAQSEDIVEFYWVVENIAGVSIIRDKNGIRTYRIHEPELTPFEGELLTRLYNSVRDGLRGKRLERLEDLRALASASLTKFKTPISDTLKTHLFYYLESAVFGWGKLEVLRRDTDIEDISCVGANKPVYIYHRRYRDMETNILFEPRELDHLITLFAQKSGKQISLANPILDATLPNGSRAQLTYGDKVSANGSAFTIRKFRETPYSVIDLLQNRTFTIEEMVYLWFAVEYNHSILIIGGTASGKTTTLNALTQFIPPLSKIITIEDTREMILHHGNWHASVVPDDGGITLFDLVIAAMRQRPEYLLVGEVRGHETLAMFQAMNTGHTTFSTFHAGDIRTAVNRLQNPPLDVPKPMIETLDIVLSQKRLYQDGEQVRRCSEIVEIVGLSDTNDFQINSVYTYHEREDTAEFAGVSDIYSSVLFQTGMTTQEFERELQRRRLLLSQMLSQGITDFRQVSEILDAYAARPDEVLEHIDSLSEV